SFPSGRQTVRTASIRFGPTSRALSSRSAAAPHHRRFSNTNFRRDVRSGSTVHQSVGQCLKILRSPFGLLKVRRKLMLLPLVDYALLTCSAFGISRVETMLVG